MMLTSAPADLQTEIGAEPILAWRAWALTGSDDAADLLLRPVSRRSRTWKPRHVVEASCHSARWHEAPDPGCTCGLHGTHDLELLRRARCPAVLGRVALWGRVIEHEHGYRARFAYPQRLRLICQFCFWRSGARRVAPEHVARFRRDELVPLCEEHLEVARRSGMAPRTLQPTERVEQQLRDRYAVDALAV